MGALAVPLVAAVGAPAAGGCGGHACLLAAGTSEATLATLCAAPSASVKSSSRATLTGVAPVSPLSPHPPLPPTAVLVCDAITQHPRGAPFERGRMRHDPPVLLGACTDGYAATLAVASATSWYPQSSESVPVGAASSAATTRVLTGGVSGQAPPAIATAALWSSCCAASQSAYSMTAPGAGNSSSGA